MSLRALGIWVFTKFRHYLLGIRTKSYVRRTTHQLANECGYTCDRNFQRWHAVRQGFGYKRVITFATLDCGGNRIPVPPIRERPTQTSKRAQPKAFEGFFGEVLLCAVHATIAHPSTSNSAVSSFATGARAFKRSAIAPYGPGISPISPDGVDSNSMGSDAAQAPVPLLNSHMSWTGLSLVYIVPAETNGDRVSH